MAPPTGRASCAASRPGARVPLIPYYGVPADARSLAEGWLQHLPVVRDVLRSDPSVTATFGILDQLALVLFLPAVLFARFYAAGGKWVHPHMALYALPPAGLGFLYLVFTEHLPLWPYVGLSVGYVAALDLWLTWRRTIFTTPSEIPLVVLGAPIGVGALLYLYSPGFWAYLTGPMPTILCFIGVLLAVVVLWDHVPATIRLAAVIWGVLLVANGSYGSRAVRLSPRTTPPIAAMGEHTRRWIEERRKDIDAHEAHETYWTGTVLGALADAYPRFPRHVFLLSGVSGGSVGVTVFASLTALSPKSGFEQTARVILDKDFLAMPLGFLLWRDPWTSAFCYGHRRLMRCASETDDRATMLERVLEGSFSLATGSDIMAKPFAELWAGERQVRVPSLLLSCTQRGDGHLGAFLARDRGGRAASAGLRAARIRGLPLRPPGARLPACALRGLPR